MGVQAVGQGLEIGVFIDFEQVVGGEGQRVQVFDHGRDRRDVDVIAHAVIQARNILLLRALALLQRRHEGHDALFGLALEGVIHLGMLGTEAFGGHDGEMRPAQDGDHIVLLAHLGHLPCVLDERRGRGDAQQFVGLARGFRLIEIMFDGVIFDGSVVYENVMARFAQHRGQIAQPQGDVLAGGPDF